MRPDIESVYDWIREPDNADTFTANDFVMWANERPTGEVLSAKFEIKTQADLIETQAALISELVGALEMFRNTYPYNPPCPNWEPKVEAHRAAEKVLTKAKEQMK